MSSTSVRVLGIPDISFNMKGPERDRCAHRLFGSRKGAPRDADLTAEARFSPEEPPRSLSFPLIEWNRRAQARHGIPSGSTWTSTPPSTPCKCFRACEGAASLKQKARKPLALPSGGFCACEGAASLKPYRLHSCPPRNPAFPRLRRRGLSLHTQFVMQSQMC